MALRGLPVPRPRRQDPGPQARLLPVPLLRQPADPEQDDLRAVGAYRLCHLGSGDAIHRGRARGRSQEDSAGKVGGNSLPPTSMLLSLSLFDLFVCVDVDADVHAKSYNVTVCDFD